MAVRPLTRAVSIEEYLRSSYDPDCDYVDGRLEERNVGEIDHATVQSLLVTWFTNHRIEWDIRPMVEVRVQVAATRFRVPDLAVVKRGRAVDQTIRQAPMICIEIFSPEDTVSRMKLRVADYLAMGVPNVWVIHSRTREGHVCRPEGWIEPENGRFAVEGTPIELSLSYLFGELDAA